MNWPACCAAVIPCLDEERTIGTVVSAMRSYVHKVLVIDDGSGDRTAEFAGQAGAEVLRHKITQGKGAALQTGWKRAHELGFNWAFTLDGDGQHSPDDAPAFFECVDRTSATLVVGNRMDHASSMPRLRRFVNRWLSRRLEILAGRAVPDSQCGLRLMRLDRWAKLPITAMHFEIESDLLFRFLLEGFRVEFVPIQVIYKEEQSKIHPWRDTIRWFRWWRKARVMKPQSIRQ